MEINPYQSPRSDFEDAPDSHDGQAGSLMCYKMFQTRSRWYWFWRVLLTGSSTKLRRQLNDDASEFINSEVGSENVVSIYESVGEISAPSLAVVVWYRVP
ncbi:MAG: hypothetical protein N2C14_17550 [Planctomycetales bacterium]